MRNRVERVKRLCAKRIASCEPDEQLQVLEHLRETFGSKTSVSTLSYGEVQAASKYRKKPDPVEPSEVETVYVPHKSAGDVERIVIS